MMGESPSQISRAGGDFNLNMLGSKLLGPSASLKSSDADSENVVPDDNHQTSNLQALAKVARSRRASATVPQERLSDVEVITPEMAESLRREVQYLKRQLDATKVEVSDAMAAMPCLAQECLAPLLEEVSRIQEDYNNIQHRFHEECVQRRQLYNKVMEFQGNIRVFCRCRPLLQKERIAGAGMAVEFNPHNHMQFTHVTHNPGGDQRKEFTFDRVYTDKVSQSEVFDDCAPIVASILDGFNVCILAYGQTGSGKTYTIWGKETPVEDNGVNHRTLHELFKVAAERSHLMEYTFYASMLEVYNDQLRDLLSPSGKARAKLEVRQAETSKEGYEIHGLEEAGPLTGMSEVMSLFRTGNINRATAATAMNCDSSRSHSLLRVRVRGRNVLTGEQSSSKLWLVDLAGSERLSRSEAVGERMKEAQHINKSLSALGDCIAALSNSSAHVPYRNSKLTQVLQDSLGGSAKCLMYIQVSPRAEDAAETLCTLHFGNRVKGAVIGTAGAGGKSQASTKLRRELVAARAAAQEHKERGEMLEASLAEVQLQLSAVASPDHNEKPTAATAEAVELLQAQVKAQKEYIARLEADLQEARVSATTTANAAAEAQETTKPMGTWAPLSARNLLHSRHELALQAAVVPLQLSVSEPSSTSNSPKRQAQAHQEARENKRPKSAASTPRGQGLRPPRPTTAPAQRPADLSRRKSTAACTTPRAASAIPVRNRKSLDSSMVAHTRSGSVQPSPIPREKSSSGRSTPRGSSRLAAKAAQPLPRWN